ncbi:4'-phosphopantetheinyl transferase superfamily protein [Simiduia curdlanivorans]|uniref:Enterobactin synthase component D n=1 Tax=Simiduia curdlanivorans TaxID=1492769 RepID=A0ABV8VB24_9GAMM|nr:4'-phosphopantetheinyl transferase superfamily protein [Simiduia curdlanivorans]MDN3638486.1 4'-phosphopantetheinyl transferase superfamily protein [Simiduia curdlanivorans]
MVESRVVEFAQGRSCARLALVELGVAPAAILRGTQREPIWPDGAVGSIAHTDATVIAVAANNHALAGLGVDVEKKAPLSAHLIPMVCREDEAVGISGEQANIVFSAKEAIYKCIFPVVQRYVDFLEVSVALDHSSGRFTAMSDGQHRDLELLRHLQGVSFVTQDLVFSVAWLLKQN